MGVRMEDVDLMKTQMAMMPTDAELLGMFPEGASNGEIARGLMQMFGLDGPDSMVTVDYDRMDEMQAERGD